MAMSSLKKGVEHYLLKCCICVKTLKDPKVLPCYHIACLTCLTSLAKGKSNFQCPDCESVVQIPSRGVIGFKDFISLDQLSDMIDKQTLNKEPILCINYKQKQEGRPDHKEATLRCADCDANYCSICIVLHEAIPATRSHRVVDIEDDSTATRRDSSQRFGILPSRVGSQNPQKKPRLIDSIQAGGRVQFITLYHQRIVAVTFNGIQGSAWQIFMHPTNDPLAKKLQDMVKKTFTWPYCVACVNHNGKQKLAMTENSAYEGIKLLSPIDGTVVDVSLAKKDAARTLAIGLNGSIIYGDYENPRSLKIIEDMKICKTIYKNEHFHPNLSCDSSGHVIMADFVSGSVMKFQKDGTVIFTYTLPKDNIGHLKVCVDSKDNILVSIRDQDRILRLNSKGEFKGYVLTKEEGISKPLDLHYEHPRLYVGQANGEIKVFTDI